MIHTGWSTSSFQGWWPSWKTKWRPLHIAWSALSTFPLGPLVTCPLSPMPRCPFGPLVPCPAWVSWVCCSLGQHSTHCNALSSFLHFMYVSAPSVRPNICHVFWPGRRRQCLGLCLTLAQLVPPSSTNTIRDTNTQFQIHDSQYTKAKKHENEYKYRRQWLPQANSMSAPSYIFYRTAWNGWNLNALSLQVKQWHLHKLMWLICKKYLSKHLKGLLGVGTPVSDEKWSLSQAVSRSSVGTPRQWGQHRRCEARGWENPKIYPPKLNPSPRIRS